MSNQIWWYTARSGGIVAWALAAASVLWGLLISTKAGGKRPRPSWMLDLHRFLGGAAVVFTGIHVASLVLDSYVHFGISEILVPFASSYRPAAVAWGVVALYLLLAVEITSLLRSRLPKRVWRSVHLGAFGLYLFATIHGITAGTDGGSALFQDAVILVSALIAGLTALRVYQAQEPTPPPRPRIPQAARAAAAASSASASANAQRFPAAPPYAPAPPSGPVPPVGSRR